MYRVPQAVPGHTCLPPSFPIFTLVVTSCCTPDAMIDGQLGLSLFIPPRLVVGRYSIDFDGSALAFF